ncbi:MAG TPA: hypothetical protein VLM38_10490 [Blastocatellia bacterium]|nr:hypothetical protein [Blastocatellia bacterium]
MFGSGQKRGTTKSGVRAATLHSIAAVMRGRSFAGRFDISSVAYSFFYTPARAAVTGGKLELIGGFSVVDARPGIRAFRHDLPNVRATLIAAQGGIGTAPPRKKLPADVMTPRPDLPVVESTGALSFAGVLYFKLTPLDARALAVPANLSKVQLNVRLAPVNDAERAMQAAFSTIVDALYGKRADESAATAAIGELNALLAGN